MELQARYIFEQWGKILTAAGSRLDQALKAQSYETDLRNFHDMDGIWNAYLGWGNGTPPPTRSSVSMRGLLVPGALLVPNVFFLVPDQDHEKIESREGIRWHPEDVRNVHFTPGLWAGDWFFMAGQGAMPEYKGPRFETAPPGLPAYFSDIEIQTATTMELLQEHWRPTASPSRASSTPASICSRPCGTTGASHAPGGRSWSRSATGRA